MKSILAVIALAAPLTLTTLNAHTASPAIEKEIRVAIDAYFAAAGRGDEDAMRRIEADEWFFSMDGTTMSKSERDAYSAKEKKTNPLPPRRYDVVIKRLISLGNEQYLVAGTNDIIFAPGTTQKKMPQAAFTEVWVKRGGQWRLLHSRRSAMASRISVKVSGAGGGQDVRRQGEVIIALHGGGHDGRGDPPRCCSTTHPSGPGR